MRHALMKSYLAEVIGTFALVFAGTGAIIINDVSGGAVTHVGIALTFGFVVMAMICALGEVSVAHLNPVVSIEFYLARQLPLRRLWPYVISQCISALAASVVLRLLFGAHPALGALMQSFVCDGAAWHGHVHRGLML